MIIERYHALYLNNLILMAFIITLFDCYAKNIQCLISVFSQVTAFTNSVNLLHASPKTSVFRSRMRTKGKITVANYNCKDVYCSYKQPDP